MQQKKSIHATGMGSAIIPNTILLSKMKIKNMYMHLRKIGRAEWNPEFEYPDFIHHLWNEILLNKELKEDSKKIQQTLGRGDAIQLLSDIYLEETRSEVY